MRQADGRSKRPRAWSPYLAGALTGVALTLAMLFADNQFGAAPFYAWLTKGVRLLIEGRGLAAIDELGRLELRVSLQHKRRHPAGMRRGHAGAAGRNISLGGNRTHRSFGGSGGNNAHPRINNIRLDPAIGGGAAG